MNDKVICKKLPPKVLALLYPLLNGDVEGFEDVYMVEIKNDDPLKHIIDDDEFFIIHDHPNQFRSQAKHLFNTEWIVLYKPTFLKILKVSPENTKKVIDNLIEMEDNILKETEEIS